ncbi:hypothetical protein DYB25_014363 [Aphanomyces astaci]|uniref:Uncharacterized protein n=1 Tax=Aphanomyces astaci TaxID=112090 RepID=A0A396ZYY8_APHAT|nr:hypothetical protein DYB36_014422 [Aphanomyces astaci]RHY38378.1 hypothetical protein DYB25_014363 [Aphanomyces astaci]RHY77431.1 hypothetical protein DYB30_012834 [Aphanomyces astaci]
MSSEADDADVSSYEQQRIAKMQRNKLAMENLGLLGAKDELKRKRQEARMEQDAARKLQKEADKSTFVPRRTARGTKPITYIQDEWRDPNEKNRQNMEALKKRLASAPTFRKDACLLCGLMVLRSAMRQHVGAHIVAESFATIRCGLCGLEASTCEHKVQLGLPTILPVGDIATTDLCPKYFPVVWKKASRGKCTNLPLRCSKCRTWLWTYTMKTHWTSVHGSTRGMSKKEAAAATVSADEIAAMTAEMERINVQRLEAQYSDNSDSSSDGAFQQGARGGVVVRSYALRERRPLGDIDTDDNEFSSAPDSDYDDESD